MVGVVAVILGGCGGRPLNDTTEATPSPSASSTATSVISRAMAAPADWMTCNLTQALIESSHVLRVTSPQPTVVTITEPFADVTDETGKLPTIDVDTAVARIDEVVSVRPDDPRAAPYETVAAGSILPLGSALAGSVMAEIAERSVYVTVGRYLPGSELDWMPHLAFEADVDGSPVFFGPCAAEWARQVGVLAARFGQRADVPFISRMVDEALLPGRTTDLDYLRFPSDRRSFEPSATPPLVAGKLRVVGLFITPLGTGQGVATIMSEYGSISGADMHAGGGAGVLIAGAVPLDGAAQIVVTRDVAVAPTPQVVAQITADELRGVEAIHVTIDTDTLVATWEPVDVAQLATLQSIYSADQMRMFQTAIQQQLDTPSTEVARPSFTTRGF